MALPKKNVAFTFDIGLVDQANRPQFKSNPTLAAGDFKVSLDGGNYANIGTLPTVTNSGKVVRVALSQAEMNCDSVTLVCSDATGAEWDDQIITFNLGTNNTDDVKTDTAAVKVKTDYLPSATAGAAGGVFISGTNSSLTITGGTTLTGAVSLGSTLGVTGVITATAGNDIRGVKLHAAGLDAITVTAPSTVPTTMTHMLVMLYRRFFNKAAVSTTEIKTYANDGTTVITTQTRAETSTTQTQGTAT